MRLHFNHPLSVSSPWRGWPHQGERRDSAWRETYQEEKDKLPIERHIHTKCDQDKWNESLGEADEQ